MVTGAKCFGWRVSLRCAPDRAAPNACSPGSPAADLHAASFRPNGYGFTIAHMSIIPGVPEAGEYGPGFEKYVKLARGATDPVGALQRQGEEVAAMFDKLTPGEQLHRYAEGKWSVQQLLHHLIDCERVFVYRALSVARKDPAPLAPFEEDEYAAAAESELWDWAELVDEYRQVRGATVSFFSHLTPEAWKRAGISNGKTITVRASAYIALGHVAHHLGVLRERYLVPSAQA
jgi:uncharacterized damage-inducible protein DinB